jgi:hypothetical protein
MIRRFVTCERKAHVPTSDTGNALELRIWRMWSLFGSTTVLGAQAFAVKVHGFTSTELTKNTPEKGARGSTLWLVGCAVPDDKCRWKGRSRSGRLNSTVDGRARVGFCLPDTAAGQQYRHEWNLPVAGSQDLD